eukprot:scaffold3315_cov353-Prasinococcus_capsulatus_cf.AAC.3
MIDVEVPTCPCPALRLARRRCVSLRIADRFLSVLQRAGVRGDGALPEARQPLLQRRQGVRRQLQRAGGVPILLPRES